MKSWSGLLSAYTFSEDTHSIDRSQSARPVYARSRDGGETWVLEDPGAGSPAPTASTLPDAGLDFTHPDLALRVRSNSWGFSLDRGRTWSKPIEFPFKEGKQTARTDYQVLGPNTCLFFLSEEKADVKCSMADRAFCALTQDGGKTFEFVAWLTADTPRSAMPSIVRLPDGTYVSALRRREDTKLPDRLPTTQNWIEAVASRDGGKGWHFLSIVASTERAPRAQGPDKE